MGSIHHFRHWLYQIVQRLVHIIPTVFVALLGSILILTCFCAIVFFSTSVLGLERLPITRLNVHRTGLYSFALTWMLGAIEFYKVMYQDMGTSKTDMLDASSRLNAFAQAILDLSHRPYYSIRPHDDDPASNERDSLFWFYSLGFFYTSFS